MHMQGLGVQSDYIDSKWRIHGTWKPDCVVCNDALSHYGVIFSYCSRRYLNGNRITSISSGAFSGLGSLDILFVTCCSHIIVDMIFTYCIVQGHPHQPDHIDCQWRIYGTWKPDFLVCYMHIFVSKPAGLIVHASLLGGR
jgi:hypothetical protein